MQLNTLSGPVFTIYSYQNLFKKELKIYFHRGTETPSLIPARLYYSPYSFSSMCSRIWFVKAKHSNVYFYYTQLKDKKNRARSGSVTGPGSRSESLGQLHRNSTLPSPIEPPPSFACSISRVSDRGGIIEGKGWKYRGEGEEAITPSRK